MPNIAAIDKIMDAIKAEKIATLDMQAVIDDPSEEIVPPKCGTSACIYGFALMTQYDVKSGEEWLFNDNLPDAQSDEMMELFGMHEETLEELIFAHRSFFPLSEITKDMALRALEDVKEGNFRSWRDYA